MNASGTEQANKAYYDAFSAGYERHRGNSDPGGYHELLDELEAGIVARYGTGRDVLEVGCGTGLVLSRVRRFARSARGVDLSPGMLALARARGLDVQERSATALPFPDSTFDVACSFKVLAHVPEIERALSEMFPRHAAGRPRHRGVLACARSSSAWSVGLHRRRGARERLYTRFDSPGAMKKLVPPGGTLVATRGVRIVTPAAVAMKVQVLGAALKLAERALCDTRLAFFGGFFIAVIQKGPA